MRLQNQTNQDVNVHDQLGDGFEEHYQPGIKNVVVPANGTFDVADVNTADSKALQTYFDAGKLKIVGKNEPAGIVGLRGAVVVAAIRVALAAGVNFQIAFGVDGGADLDQIATSQLFLSSADYVVQVTLESALATDVISITKLATDFTINSANASAAAVTVFRVV